MRQLSTTDDFALYEEWVQSHPHGNFWQSLARKTYLEALGKEVRVYIAEIDGVIESSALVVIDRTTGGLSTWEIPRGPLLADGIDNEQLIIDNLLTQIIEDAKENRCLCVYLSPQQSLPIIHYPLSIIHSGRYVHAEATRIIDLTKSEEEILAGMHPKGRYNIKVAEKHGVTVHPSDDIDAFARLASETAQRDGFQAHRPSHYQAFLKTNPGAFLLLAYAPENQTPIAGLLGIVCPPSHEKDRGEALGLVGPSAGATPLREKGAPEGKTVGFPLRKGMYYYGASDYTHRAKMAPYLLQWEAMKLCKARSCTSYDLLGIAPPNAGPNHPWSGISEFKEKFGGTVITYPPEQMIVLRPMMKALLDLKRKMWK